MLASFAGEALQYALLRASACSNAHSWLVAEVNESALEFPAPALAPGTGEEEWGQALRIAPAQALGSGEQAASASGIWPNEARF